MPKRRYAVRWPRGSRRADRTPLGKALLEGLEQVLAFQRGEVSARVRTYRRVSGEWVLIGDEMTTGPALREARAKRAKCE